MVENFYNMDYDVAVEKLIAALWKKSNLDDFLYGGHVEELHSGMSDEQLIQRMWSEQKEYVSSFYSAEVARDNIQDAMLSNIEDITDWLQMQNGKGGPVYTVKMDAMDPIGYGFETGFKKLESNGINIVLERNKDSAYGFYVKTAFVDLEDKDLVTVAEDAGRYTKRDILRSNAIHPQNDLEYTAFAKAGLVHDKGIKICYREDQRTDERYISIEYQDPRTKDRARDCPGDRRTKNPGHYVAYIHEDKVRVPKEVDENSLLMKVVRNVNDYYHDRVVRRKELAARRREKAPARDTGHRPIQHQEAHAQQDREIHASSQGPAAGSALDMEKDQEKAPKLDELNKALWEGGFDSLFQKIGTQNRYASVDRASPSPSRSEDR